MSKFMLILTGLLILPHQAAATSNATWVVALDLSWSVGMRSGGQDSAFARNLDAVTRMLAQVPAGSRITVIGITENSFLQPSILLSANIPDDPGYFGERLTTARTEVVKAWLARSRQLAPTAKHTDILGALLLAADLFARAQVGTERRLVILSDMRQSTSTLNLESASVIPEFPKIRLKIPSMTANLKGVDVYVIGVEEVNTSTAYWQSLRRFWRDYFQSAGATVRRYSVLRDLP